MVEATFSEPRFHDETAARKFLEAIRWPNGPVCPHCGGTERNSALNGKAHRPGLWFCGDCRKQFSVTVGTVFERSKIPLHKWLLATHLLVSSKKGISSHQIHRTLGVTYKTAWFMTHRIRESMKEPQTEQLGGEGTSGVVEADETFWGNKGRKRRIGRTYKQKDKIVALVERGGRARAFHVPSVNQSTLRGILHTQIAKSARVVTDQHPGYRGLSWHFAKHDFVNHSIGEYVRGDVTTNSIEGYFSILKRGLTGVYQHVSSEHLKRYLGEFDFRYSYREVNDSERANIALKGIEGKRLTYRPSH